MENQSPIKSLCQPHSAIYLLCCSSLITYCKELHEDINEEACSIQYLYLIKNQLQWVIRGDHISNKSLFVLSHFNLCFLPHGRVYSTYVMDLGDLPLMYYPFFI